MPKTTSYFDSWIHGFVRVDSKGRKVFIIRQQIEGKIFKVSTKAHSLDRAMEEYRAWAADPHGYVAGAGIVQAAPATGLPMNRALVDEFLAWSEKEGFHGRGNSVGHIANQRIALDFWLTNLPKADLHSVELERDILPALKSGKQQANKRRTLKAFFSWLRSEAGGNRLKLGEDPTARALKVPKSKPAERTKLNKAVEWEDVLKVRDGTKKNGKDVLGLQGHWRATFIVQMATGWHNTELKRFATDGFIEPYYGKQKAAGVLVVKHKSGAEHRTAVDEFTVWAALEMLGYGSFEPANYSKEVARISVLVTDSEFSAGQMRHTIATKMVNEGADIATVSTFLGHRSPATTLKFYATHAVSQNPSLSAV